MSVLPSSIEKSLEKDKQRDQKCSWSWNRLPRSVCTIRKLQILMLVPFMLECIVASFSVRLKKYQRPKTSKSDKEIFGQDLPPTSSGCVQSFPRTIASLSEFPQHVLKSPKELRKRNDRNQTLRKKKKRLV